MNNKLLPKIKFQNKPEDEMLIGAYVEPLVYGKYLKDYDIKVSIDTAYDQLKAANFNTVMQTESAMNREDNQITLDMFENLSKRNMNFLFRDRNITGEKDHLTKMSEKELVAYFEKEYKPLLKYSAFAGMHFIDEFGYKSFARCKEIKNAFKSVFPDKLFFTNLLQTYAPAWAFPNGPIYEPDSPEWLPDDPDFNKYFDRFVKEADPEIFSYDYYPMRYEFPYMLDDYFLQLHVAYKYSKISNTPLNCFIQAGTWDTQTRIPNDNELRWQLNCALAYNTKAISYYTYWAPNPEHKKMCINEFGERTTHYYLIQQLNKEILFQDEYYLNADFKGYIQLGKMPNNEIPVAEDRLNSFGNIKEFTGGNFFIGCFDYYKNDKKQDMYVIVNNSIETPEKQILTFNKPIAFTKIHRETVEKIYADKLEINLTPGDAYIIIEE